MNDGDWTKERQPLAFFSTLLEQLGETAIEQSLSPELFSRLQSMPAEVLSLEVTQTEAGYVFCPRISLIGPCDGTLLRALYAALTTLPQVAGFKPVFHFAQAGPTGAAQDLSVAQKALHCESLFSWIKDELNRHGQGALSLLFSQSRLVAQEDRLLICPAPAVTLLFTPQKIQEFKDFIKDQLGFDVPMSLSQDAKSDLFDEGASLESLWDEMQRKHIASIQEVPKEPVKVERAETPEVPKLNIQEMQATTQVRDRYYDRVKAYQKVGEQGVIWGQVPREEKEFLISDLNLETGKVLIRGQAHGLEVRRVKNGKSLLFTFSIFSDTGSIRASLFVDEEKAGALTEELKSGRWYLFFVRPVLDNYTNDVQARVMGLKKVSAPIGRSDNAPVKRIELHCHTQMSQRDALSDIGDLVRLAAHFGHKALAITDHGVVQAFPQAESVRRQLAKEGKDLKLIYGMEGYLVEDGRCCVYGPDLNDSIGNRFVCLNLETEGSAKTGRIRSIQAKRYVLSETGYFVEDELFERGGERSVNAMPEADGALESASLLEADSAQRDASDSATQHQWVIDFAKFLGTDTLVGFKALDQLAYLRYEGMRVSPKYAPRQKFNPVTVDLSELVDFVLRRRVALQRGYRDENGQIAYERAGALDTLDGDQIAHALRYAKAQTFATDERQFFKAGEAKKALAALEEAFVKDEEARERSQAFDLLSGQSAGQEKNLDLPVDANGAMVAAAPLSEEIDAIARCFALAALELGCREGQEFNKKLGKLSMTGVKNTKNKARHIIYLSKDALGLYHLYRLVSESNVHYFYFRPRCPRSLLRYFSAGLIIGSACEAGELFRSMMDLYQKAGSSYEKALELMDDHEVSQVARFYDYLEIQPLGNNAFLLRKENNGIHSETDLQNLNRLIVALAKRQNKPFVATCDSHFLEDEDFRYRSVMLDHVGMKDSDFKVPLFFRTTEEMLAEFQYLSPEDRDLAVLTYPARVADWVTEYLEPFPSGSYPPEIDSAPDDVRQMVYDSMKRLYEHEGQVPALVSERVERELQSIIGNGFSIMYFIAHHLVKKSNDDGYVVGSRGSVGSSFVATLCGITEVNPLTPHYRCPNCRYSEFDESGDYGSGFDLPEKNCPKCGTKLDRDGQDIPFETFLGFDGDKQPDIDLNFSGVYQMRAHEFIREMFGRDYTFRAGTVSAFQEKTCFGMVKKYAEIRNLSLNRSEIERMAHHLMGVKSTTGQHPGGIVVIPKDRDIYDFTPIQYPAEKADSPFCTTHYDFNSLHDTILKLDVLGHDDPTMLRVLSDLTGVDVLQIPIPDPEVMALFTGTEALGIETGKGPAAIGTLGLPEMGTFMARGMIQDIQPKRFYDLVQLLGLSHGTDVWKGNAQDLILNGICTINDVIGCRDSIMTRLIYWGLPKKAAFDIMEKVRKGKGLSEDQEALMREHDVPDWYIDSCKKIKYMFPKAHAAAYAISALRIAWFKVHIPEAWYCAWYSVRAKMFKAQNMCVEPKMIVAQKQAIRQSGKMVTDKTLEKEFYCYEIVEEMYQRGIRFDRIDLYESEANLFTFDRKNWVRPALSSIDGVSEANAEAIVKARASGKFKSREDLQRRSGISKTAMDALESMGLLKDLPESNQIDLLGLLG